MENEYLKIKFQKCFSDTLLKVEVLNHPGNNTNYKAQTSKGQFVIKEYSTFQKDNWNRGLREFESLKYLRDIGFKEIPIPVKFFTNDNIGIYSFMPGVLLKPEEVKTEDILAASNFLARLHKINSESKASIPEERTACFSTKDYLKLLENRLKNLVNYNDQNPLANELQDFLKNKVAPLKENLIKKLTIENEIKLSLNEQVLTPGDYGFHNILVDETEYKKRYTFLDLEYFGRDDPIKQILDFLHHDRHKAIPRSLRNLFLENYLKKTDRNEKFIERIKLIDPLIGLNWTLIYLTPFTKESIDPEELLRTRLNKAKYKIENLKYFN